MSRVRTRLRTGAMFVSAFLLAATCFAWVRSLRFEELFSYSRTLPPTYAPLVAPGQYWQSTLTLELQQGAVYLQRNAYLYAPDQEPGPTFTWLTRPVEWRLFGCTPASPDVRYAFAGFSFARWDRYSTSWRSQAVRVPLWSMASASATWPALGLIATMRRRRAYGKGYCTSCGYDLRATPERCPECGRVAVMQQ